MLQFALYQRNCNCINVITLEEKKKNIYIPDIYHSVPRDYSHITFEILIRIRIRISEL